MLSPTDFRTFADDLTALVTSEGNLKLTVQDQSQRLQADAVSYAALRAEYDAYKATHTTADQIKPPLNSDNFVDLSQWGIYDAANSYDKQGIRLAANTTVAGNVLSLQTRPVTSQVTRGTHTLNPGDYAAAGAYWKHAFNPGVKFAFDMTMTPSYGTRAVALLWPSDNSMGAWPRGGELDFVENGGVTSQADRKSTIITNHYYDPSKPNNNGQNPVRIVHDFTVWTHVEVLWKTNLFVVSYDGVEVWRTTEHVPANPQELVFQTAVEGGGQSPLYNGVKRDPGTLRARNLRVDAA